LYAAKDAFDMTMAIHHNFLFGLFFFIQSDAQKSLDIVQEKPPESAEAEATTRGRCICVSVGPLRIASVGGMLGIQSPREPFVLGLFQR
jgi:hypothetical protein